jgi:hypothetical protein
MTRKSTLAAADELPKLRGDAERAMDRYSSTATNIERVFFDFYGENLSADVLRLVAARFLEMAQQREPAPVSGPGSSRAYGWRKLSVITRDEATLPTTHLIASLNRSGWSPQEVGDELTARRIATLSGRFDWRPHVVKAVAERETNRQPIWTGALILAPDYRPAVAAADETQQQT